MTNQELHSEIKKGVERGGLFVINHSGGKDSQALLIKMKNLVPASQILVIHAELPGVEWAGTMEHARDTSEGLEFKVARAGKTFLEMVQRRGFWPSPKYRQCTSDLKRGPIEKVIRHHIKENNLSGLVFNCMGLRAEESSSRAKLDVFKFNKRNSKAGREWYDVLPIHDFTVEDVFRNIQDAGQKPHWAYEKGMSRLSCCFCIMATKKDLKIAAEHNPEIFKSILKMEKEIDQTFIMPKKGQDRVFLDQYLGMEV